MWKEIAKKNVVSIICGVIALVAVIASVWPADGWVTDLQAGLDARGQANTALERLLTKPRNLPNLDPNSTTPVALTQFPSEKVIAQGDEATKQMKVVSAKLFEAAVDLNRRELLVPGSLPRSTAVPKLRFRDDYALAMQLRPDAGAPALPEWNIPSSILKGTQPVTPEEIADAQNRLWDDKYVSRVVLINGQPANLEQQHNDFNDEAAVLPDLMRRQRAEQNMIYVLPEALTLNAGVQGGAVPSEEDVWSAQLGLWIQQDVARAIAATNASSKAGIIDAPVKQLVKLDVPLAQGGAAGLRAPGARGADATAAVAGVPSDPTVAITPDYAVAPTGRGPNGLFDVYEFVLTVDVEAAQLPALLNELTRGRYVAVYTVNAAPVDLPTLAAAGFIYGPRPVVRAVLHCETLMLRAWTEQFMPDSVKQDLGIATPVAPPAAQ